MPSNTCSPQKPKIKAATCKEHLQVQTEGKRDNSRVRKFYNLPVIMAVGFRVRCPRGNQYVGRAMRALPPAPEARTARPTVIPSKVGGLGYEVAAAQKII